MNKRTVGSRYEDIAAAFLARKGYRLITRNFRNRWGEIDLICEDGAVLVFVEVKYRSTARFGLGMEHVNKKKQQTIAKIAEYYLYVNHITDRLCRFDVVSINGAGEITHYPDAFQG